MNVNREGAARLELDIDVWLDAATGVYVGWCPALDVYSQGETEREARCAAIDAVELYVKHMAIRNRLRRTSSNAEQSACTR